MFFHWDSPPSSHFLQCHTSLLYCLQALKLKSYVILNTSQDALDIWKDTENACKLCEMMKCAA